MIRALIVDDELHAREELAALLAESGEVEVAGSCANAPEALKAIHRLRPDVLFLDVQMPLIDGFEMLAMIDPENMPQVVFVTAYDEYALKAFEEKTLDYLLKPVEKERLARTIEKLKGALLREPHPSFGNPPIHRIPCLCAGRIKLVDPGQIDHVRSDLAGVHVVTPAGEFFTELTLKILETRTGLVRCHKQHLVNLAQVDEIALQEGGGAELRTRAGHRLPVSRRYLKALKDALGF